MIDFYTWATPNGRKVSIMLEEAGLAYAVHPVDIAADEQFKPEFVAISPNGKIPAIVDSDGPGGMPISLFESGAILIYLAEKSGSELLPGDPRERYGVLQWLMFQMGGVGPVFGQVHHYFRHAPEDIAYAKARAAKDQKRLYTTLDRQLAANAFIAGGTYSIADIAIYPWVARYEWHPVDLAADFPYVKRWFDELSARPAVQRGMAIPKAG